jgi:hypothetical protein
MDLIQLHDTREALVKSLYEHRQERERYNKAAQDADNKLCDLIYKLKMLIEGEDPWLSMYDAPENQKILLVGFDGTQWIGHQEGGRWHPKFFQGREPIKWTHLPKSPEVKTLEDGTTPKV